VVFTGLGNDLETATKFIDDELSKAKLHPPMECYPKGDFRGALYHRYDSALAANAAIRHFDRSKLQLAGQTVKCKPELPVEQRACLGMVLGLRYHLIQWGFDRKNIKVDDAIPTLSVGGSPVLKVSIAKSEIKIDWLDPTWEAWNELLNTEEYKELVQMSNKRLSQAAEHKKGMGKGNKGGAGVSQQ
jgi:hypothetical protein